jgi:hypothetical protein
MIYDPEILAEERGVFSNQPRMAYEFLTRSNGECRLKLIAWAGASRKFAVE